MVYCYIALLRLPFFHAAKLPVGLYKDAPYVAKSGIKIACQSMLALKLSAIASPYPCR